MKWRMLGVIFFFHETEGTQLILVCSIELKEQLDVSQGLTCSSAGDYWRIPFCNQESMQQDVYTYDQLTRETNHLATNLTLRSLL